MKKTVRVGSRESALAIAQSSWVIEEIRKKHPDIQFELIHIKTQGDINLDTRLDKIGGKGLFIKELEYALIEGKIDIAVHSLKDMPAEIPEELRISIFSKREDPRDVLVTKDGKTLEQLNMGAVVGTSSIRREVQIQSKRPDIRFKLLRGNVLTRLNKLLNNEYDAIVLAAAGLKRLGLQEKCTQYFDVEDLIPAVGQGILAVETRKKDNISYLLDSVHCPQSALEAAAERSFMIKLDGGCTTPMAAHAVVEGDSMKVFGMLAGESRVLYKAYVEGNKYDSILLGEKVAEIVLSKSRI